MKRAKRITRREPSESDSAPRMQSISQMCGLSVVFRPTHFCDNIQVEGTFSRISEYVETECWDRACPTHPRHKEHANRRRRRRIKQFRTNLKHMKIEHLGQTIPISRNSKSCLENLEI